MRDHMIGWPGLAAFVAQQYPDTTPARRTPERVRPSAAIERHLRTVDARMTSEHAAAARPAPRMPDDEVSAFEFWLDRERPSGDVDQVQHQWATSADRAEFLDVTTICKPARVQAPKLLLNHDHSAAFAPADRAAILAQLRGNR